VDHDKLAGKVVDGYVAVDEAITDEIETRRGKRLVAACLGGKREGTGRETVNHPAWSPIRTEMHQAASLGAEGAIAEGICDAHKTAPAVFRKLRFRPGASVGRRRQIR
jgi:hypothetical protein